MQIYHFLRKISSKPDFSKIFTFPHVKDEVFQILSNLSNNDCAILICQKLEEIEYKKEEIQIISEYENLCIQQQQYLSSQITMRTLQDWGEILLQSIISNKERDNFLTRKELLEKRVEIFVKNYQVLWEI